MEWFVFGKAERIFGVDIVPGGRRHDVEMRFIMFIHGHVYPSRGEQAVLLDSLQRQADAGKFCSGCLAQFISADACNDLHIHTQST